MVIILDLAQARIKKQRVTPQDLNDFLERATQLINEISLHQENDVITITKNKRQFKKRLEGKIAKKMIKTKMISRGLFLCGIYIPQVFTEYFHSSPESWLPIDFILKAKKLGEAFILKRGGDVCFLICSVFTERGNWGNMNLDYYQGMGKTFYHQFHAQTKKEIGYHMSKNFEIMAKLTKECVLSI